MKQKSPKKVLKKQNSFKVSKKFTEWVEGFMNNHQDALKELAKL